MKYSYGAYNKWDDNEQWIRITEGCPHDHEYCYEPTEIKVFEFPKIIRNKVKIMDMNFLVPKKHPKILLSLLPYKLNNRIIRYEFICGIDYRFLDKTIAQLMKNHHFQRIRIAWDFELIYQYDIKKALDILYSVGYKPKDIIIFMICNWRISFEENMKKLDLCKVWNIKVADCYFDNQTDIIRKPFKEEYWKPHEAVNFRRKTRTHNQIVNFKIYPEVK